MEAVLVGRDTDSRIPVLKLQQNLRERDMPTVTKHSVTKGHLPAPMFGHATRSAEKAADVTMNM